MHLSRLRRSTLLDRLQPDRSARKCKRHESTVLTNATATSNSSGASVCSAISWPSREGFTCCRGSRVRHLFLIRVFVANRTRKNSRFRVNGVRGFNGQDFSRLETPPKMKSEVAATTGFAETTITAVNFLYLPDSRRRLFSLRRFLFHFPRIEEFIRRFVIIRSISNIFASGPSTADLNWIFEARGKWKSFDWYFFIAHLIVQ